MALAVASLLIKLGADTKEAEAGITSMSDQLGPASGLVMGAGIAAAALIGIGVASTVMAGNFQAGMTSLVTGAGESQKNIGMVSNAILQMAVDTGTTTKQLTDGMYMIESAGYHGKAGLDILKAAAEGAKVGTADLGVVADATTTIMTDFGGEAGGASGAVNLLIATVASGKTHMQDLAASLSQVAPTAAAAKVKLTDMMGALATMTGEGVPAANAATYLRQTIIGLSAPSAGAAKALKAVGLSSADVAAEMQKSLPDALKMITDAVGKKFPVGSAAYVNALKNIAGGSKTMQGMLDLTGTHLKTFQGNVAGVSEAVKHGGKSINGWSEVQGDFNQQMDRAKEVVEVLMIRLGQQLLPVATKLFAFIANTAVPAIMKLTTWLSGNSASATAAKAALTYFAIVITGILVGAFIAWAVAAWNAAVATIAATWPILLIGIAVVAFIAIVIALIAFWPQIAGFFNNIGKAIWNFTVGAWNALVGWTVGVWNAIVGFFTRIVVTIQMYLLLWQMRFHAGIALLQALIHAGFERVVAIITAPIHAVMAIFAWLFNHNTYFHDLVVAIQAEFNRAKSFIVGIWTTIKGWLADAWAFIQHAAQREFELVRQYIITPIQRVVAQVEERITYAKLMLTAAWVEITARAKAAWANFTGMIATAVNTVKTDISNIVNAIMTPITGLATTLFNAGKNLIQMLINGITSMAGKVGQAAGNIAKNIAGFLGFHSPTEQGPGATADQWMPALGNMLASGLTAQAAKTGAAARKVAGAIAGGITGASGGALGVNATGAGSISGLPASQAAALAGASSAAAGAGNGQPMQVTLVVDGHQLAQTVVRYTPGVIRQATGVRSF